MKRKIYIETSVVSYLVSRPSKDVVVAGHQAATRDFWGSIRNYDVFISDIVVQEAADGNETQAKMRLEALSGIPVIEIDDHVKTLAKKLIQGRAVPEKFIEDAFHIAVAAKHGMDVIVTWNFSHINNPFTRMMIRQIIENNGFACPEICSPDEFTGDET